MRLVQIRIMRQMTPLPFRRRFGNTLWLHASWQHLAITGILLATLSLVMVSTVQTVRSIRREATAAAKALDYRAAFAAASYRAQLEAWLYTGAMAQLRPVLEAHGGPHGLPLKPTFLRVTAAAALACQCVNVIPASAFFSVDLDSRRLAIDTADSSNEHLTNGLIALVSTHARARYRQDWPFAIVTDSASSPRVIVYTLVRDAVGRPTRAYGIITDTARLRPAIFDRAFRKTQLVPGSAEPEQVSRLLSIAVRAPDGAVVFESSPVYRSSHVARTSLADFFGLLSVEVSPNDGATLPTIVGEQGLSSVALLVLLVSLTGGLLVAAIVLSWREAELTRLRSSFTSSVSHELRTPLTQVLLYAETLALGRSRTLAEAQHVGRVVVREARRLIHLVENTLHFERSAHGMTIVRTEPQRVAPVVRQAVEDFTSIVDAEGLAVQLDLDELAEADIDRDAVRQIIINLLDNAVRYGPIHQCIRVELRTMQDAGMVRISVCDQGPGIARRDRERVWKPFVRLEYAERAGTTGTGIGLAIVRQLVTLHGGRVGIEDEHPGARVFVEFPAVNGQASNSAPTGERIES